MRRYSIAFLLALAAAQPVSARPVFINVAPTDPSLQWHLHMYQDCKLAVCRKLMGIALNQKTQNPSLCVLSDPAAWKAAGISSPTWQRLDYRQNLELVKSLTTDHLLGNDPALRPYNKSKDGSNTGEELRQMRDTLWRKEGDKILALFVGGKAGLDAARFDVDSDGVAEWLYRIPNLMRSANGAGWEVEFCDDASRFPRLRTAVDPAEARQRLGEDYASRLVDQFGGVIEVIKYNGTSYKLSPSQGAADLTETRKDGAGINQYVMNRDWWNAFIGRSRGEKGGVNLTWPELDRKK